MVDSARQKVREQQQLEAKKQNRNRVLAVITVVLLAVLAIVGIFTVVGQQQRKKAAEQTAQGSAVAQAVTSIPASTFDAIAPTVQQGAFQPDPQAPKTDKPRVLYIGADFCPFCAVERLALTASLSRFGTFEGLKDGLSSPNEGQISNIPTVTYRGSSFSSDVLDFTAVETADRMGQPTGDRPTAEDQALFQRLVPTGSIPFVHYGSVFTSGATYDAASDFAGKSEAELAAALKDPNSAETKKVVGASNVITAQICKQTGNKPENVCSSKGVTEAAKALQ